MSADRPQPLLPRVTEPNLGRPRSSVFWRSDATKAVVEVCVFADEYGDRGPDFLRDVAQELNRIADNGGEF